MICEYCHGLGFVTVDEIIDETHTQIDVTCPICLGSGEVEE